MDNPENNRILVIDDDSMIREVLKNALEPEGFTIDEAENGNEALTKIAKIHYALIITDLIMPGKDGIGLMMDILKKWPRTKFFTMSGGGFIKADSYLKMSRKLGACATFTKPLKVDAVVAKVKELFGE